MRFYRIADSRHSPESGEGARLHGGRWNSPGRAVIYACETAAGAMLEKLVHTNGRIPKHQVLVIYEVPDSIRIDSIRPEEIAGWDKPDMIASRKICDARLEKNDSAILRVPSVVFDYERNVVINPGHPDFSKIKAIGKEPVRWDGRLFEDRNARSKSGD